MAIWQGLKIETEGTGITTPLSEQVRMLGMLLGHAVRQQAGDDMLQLIEQLRTLCKEAAATGEHARRDEAVDIIQKLSTDQILWLLRGYTTFFHLVNKAEQREIVRINRERQREATETKPRVDSIDDVIYQLKQNGVSFEQLRQWMTHLDIQPTFTAHPTEVRRRSVSYKQREVATQLARLQEQHLLAAERDEAVRDIYSQISLLLATDEVRADRPSVIDEVEHGLQFFRTSVWQVVPQLHRDLQEAVARHYEEEPELPVFLRFRSWVGGDRDGNPNVTAEVTRTTLHLHRQVITKLYLDELRALWHDLSISDQIHPPQKELTQSLKQDSEAGLLSKEEIKPFRHEPFRIKIGYMMARLRRILDDNDLSTNNGYTGTDFIADLELLQRCLKAVNMEKLAESGRLTALLLRAKTFGFHLAALDIRQHSHIHEQAVAQLLDLGGVCATYSELPEDERLHLLKKELQNRRPLLPRHAALNEEAALAIETMQVIAEALQHDPDSIGCYIISMTDAVSDMLEVLLLLKEAGLWQYDGETVETAIDVVPLLETVNDLERAESFMNDLFTNPVYRAHLQARNMFQEIMLGYSDSNKDGGYWMANWALHKAQAALARICRKHDVEMRLFHGRGGTVGRGGGRANHAIYAMPPESHNGRIRFTEQGEVISFRYAREEIAHRHLEQIINATLKAMQPEKRTSQPEDEAMMETLADESMQAYRSLIDDEAFWPWYVNVTPIEHISNLPIASRPVSRKGSEVDFEGLRAIPWNFAWTQTRFNVPGWYGIGVALNTYIDAKPENLETLREHYQNWNFFRTVTDNAQLEMARARLPIARHYARLSEGDFHDHIEKEFEAARTAILKITGQSELLDNSPVIQKSIRLRNPYTDVLNLLQIELLRRWQQQEKNDALRKPIFLAINGVAAAMQSTG